MDSELAQTKTMKTEMAVMRPQTKECWWPGDAGKEKNSLLEASEGTHYPHLEFGPVVLI